MPENNRRYTDKGAELNPIKDTLGALKRKLAEEAEGKTFTPRETDSKAFVDQIRDETKEFALRAESAGPALEAPQQTSAEQSGHQSGLLILLSKSPYSPEHKKYIEKAAEKALPEAKKSFENAGITLPTDNEILQQMVMVNRFRPEQIEALIRTVQAPGLIILPPQMQKFTDYEKFLNANKKRQGQRDVVVSDSRKIAFGSQDAKLQNSALYRFGIGELAQELKDKRGKLRNIVAKWEQSDLAKVLRVPTPREYAVLDGQAPDLLDLQGWSILCEENESHNIIGEDNLVSGGGGYGSWDGVLGVNFDGGNPGDGYNGARVRPVVVG